VRGAPPEALVAQRDPELVRHTILHGAAAHSRREDPQDGYETHGGREGGDRAPKPQNPLKDTINKMKRKNSEAKTATESKASFLPPFDNSDKKKKKGQSMKSQKKVSSMPIADKLVLGPLDKYTIYSKLSFDPKTAFLGR